MDFAHYWFQSQAGSGYQIGNSLRFRAGQWLDLAPTGRGGGDTLTISYWVKIGNTELYAGGGQQAWLIGTTLGSNPQGAISAASLASDNNCAMWSNAIGISGAAAKSAGAMRDKSAWYHHVWRWNGNVSPQLYINGVLSPMAQANAGGPGATLNANYNPRAIGAAYSAHYNPFDGHLAELHYCDGQYLGPETFGEFNADGVWCPIEVNLTTAQYGGNGFYLDFSDPANIGADRSGQGNNFTPTNFELTNTSSTSYDWMADSPTNNFSTLNAVYPVSPYSTSKANLAWSANGANDFHYNSTQFAETGKYYWEVKANSNSMVGVGEQNKVFHVYPGRESTSFGWYGGAGQIYNNEGVIATVATFTDADTLGFLLDNDALTCKLYKNNVLQTTLNLTGPSVPQFGRQYSSGDVNFGQRPYTYSLPSGAQPWSTAGLPDVAITNPSEHFTTILDTGANILTNAQATFPKGLWWIKDRANSNQHQLVNNIRGNSVINLPENNAGRTYTTPAGNSVAWCWNAPEAFAPTGTNGITNLTGYRNVNAGFSMVQYTSQPSGTGTVAHGLSKAPEFITSRKVNQSHPSYCYHHSLNPNEIMVLNNSGAKFSSDGIWGSTRPTSTHWTSGTDYGGSQVVMTYLWHSVPGYSAFGKWDANGVRDGAFIFLGFRPALLIYKVINGAANWGMRSSAIDTYNPSTKWMYANGTAGETTGLQIDLLSNGFKWREDGGQGNNSGQQVIYMAWAEHPFGGGNVSPSPAR